MLGSAPLIALAVAAGFGPFPSPRHPVTRDAVAGRADRASPALLARSADRAPTSPPLRGGEGRGAGAHLEATAYVPWSAYRTVVGSFQGPRCPHTPSCSVYALSAVGRYGLVAGGVVTVPRLLRGARSSAVLALPRAADGRLVDLLEDATFWMGGRER